MSIGVNAENYIKESQTLYQDYPLKEAYSRKTRLGYIDKIEYVQNRTELHQGNVRGK